jgi:acyl-CoA synthetase (AMP-forming)/AMP-acid ligase II
MEVFAASIGNIDCLGSQEITSGDCLWYNANQWSKSLKSAGAAPDRIVGLAVPASADFFSALFGIWQTGACALVVDPGLSPPERHNICRFAEPIVMVSANSDDWPATVISKPGRQAGSGQTSLQLSGAAPALALLTSGTTGKPKIVVLSFAALDARIGANIAAIGADTLSKTLQTLSLSFGHGLIGSALTTLMAGGTLILPRPGPALTMKLGNLIDQHAISFMTSVPAFWHMVLKASPPPSGGCLKRVHVGSAPLAKSRWEKVADWADCPVFNCYGMTETANWVAAAPYTDRVVDGEVGRCFEGKFAVAGEGDSRNALGTGEVLVRSAGLMTAYLKQPEATAAVLRDDWYHTGDVGRLDQDGCLTLVGRQKEEINRAGSKVQPVEVDQLLETHPDIVEACTFAVPDAVSGEAVATAIVLSSGRDLDAHELTRWCIAQARKEIVPSHWYFVEQLCRTGRGKLDRVGQRKLLFENGK